MRQSPLHLIFVVVVVIVWGVFEWRQFSGWSNFYNCNCLFLSSALKDHLKIGICSLYCVQKWKEAATRWHSLTLFVGLIKKFSDSNLIKLISWKWGQIIKKLYGIEFPQINFHFIIFYFFKTTKKAVRWRCKNYWGWNGEGKIRLKSIHMRGNLARFST